MPHRGPPPARLTCQSKMDPPIDAKRFASMGGSILDWQVSLAGGGPRCGMEEIFGTRAMTHEYDVDETTDEENDDDE